MTHGTLWSRLTRGTSWTWIAERHRAALPGDLSATVMDLDARDRLHRKQGRSTARVVFHTAEGTLPVYLKRHYRVPWPARLAALVAPGGRYTPAGVEWANLDRARALGVAVPEVVAAGERIGPWGTLQGFLMVAELTGLEPLHELIPALAARLDPAAFARLKRGWIAEMAEAVARLHRAHLFHKDLYLCHFFAAPDGGGGLRLIDLHRLARHRAWAWRWRAKDLGQLLFSTQGVAGIGPRDVARFWREYRERVAPVWPRWQGRMAALKAARYRAHNP